MNDIKIISHINSSVDGRLIADRWTLPFDGRDIEDVLSVYTEIKDGYSADAWILGRNSVQRHFFPETFNNGIFTSVTTFQTYIGHRDSKRSLVIFDSKGLIRYTDDKVYGDNIIAVLGENVSEEYLEHLRQTGISYIKRIIIMSENKSEKNLLPETEYRAWDKAEIDERMRTMALLLKFNTTGDKKTLEEVFGRNMDGVTIFAPLHCNYGDSRVKFGKRVFINYNCTFQPAGGVEIGDDVFIGSDVRIYTTNHSLNPEERATGKATVRPVKIGSKVWIGGGVVILPGVEIGEGTTIGAGSVVTRSIPARCVAVGNPCRVIKKLQR